MTNSKQTRNMKKFLKIFFGTLAAIIVIAAVAVACLWGREIATIRTVSQLDKGGYLYQMEYKASYDLDEVINSDIDSNAGLLGYVAGKITHGLPLLSTGDKKEKESAAEPKDACTSFQAAIAGGEGYLYGRNYDMMKNPTMVVKSHPKKGYASISTCDLSHLGYSLEKLPQSFKEKLFCVATIYAPMDGMNEKGLCTSIMALPKQPAAQNSGKHKVGTSIIMRLWLDRCATVQEALDLLATVDVCHDQQAGSGYHYMVADASGDCAVVEFDKENGWQTLIVRKGEDRQAMHVTNHLLSPAYYTTEPDIAVGNPHSKSWWRYGAVDEYLRAHNDCLTVGEAQECLSMVHWKDLVWEDGTVEDTQFSNVYDQAGLKLYLRPWNDYETTYGFEL